MTFHFPIVFQKLQPDLILPFFVSQTVCKCQKIYRLFCGVSLVKKKKNVTIQFSTFPEAVFAQRNDNYISVGKIQNIFHTFLKIIFEMPLLLGKDTAVVYGFLLHDFHSPDHD